MNQGIIINTERAALRAIAELASPGPWESFTEEHFSGWWAIGHTGSKHNSKELGSGDGGYEKEDADHIAAFNPKSAIALLDELDQKDAQIVKMAAEAERLSALIANLQAAR